MQDFLRHIFETFTVNMHVDRFFGNFDNQLLPRRQIRTSILLKIAHQVVYRDIAYVFIALILTDRAYIDHIVENILKCPCHRFVRHAHGEDVIRLFFGRVSESQAVVLIMDFLKIIAFGGKRIGERPEIECHPPVTRPEKEQYYQKAGA